MTFKKDSEIKKMTASQYGGYIKRLDEGVKKCDSEKKDIQDAKSNAQSIFNGLVKNSSPKKKK